MYSTSLNNKGKHTGTADSKLQQTAGTAGKYTTGASTGVGTVPLHGMYAVEETEDGYTEDG